MKWLRNSLLLIAGLGIAALLLAAHYYYKGSYRPARTHGLLTVSRPVDAGESGRIAQKALGLKKFVAQGNFNQRIVFLVDMRLPSGKNRFFVYDLSKDSILQAALAAHGCGNSSFSFSPSFSNIEGSNCSALGRYRVGSAYTGHFGRSYLLYGLDTSNDHALDRHIVLHSYGCVPEVETDPYPICNSQGCAMVAPGFLNRLKPVIDHSSRPILLWIFY
jgi:hypothetical protein